MRKYFLFSGITLIGLTTIFLIYISIFGIKTNNFNKFINDKLKDYDSRLSLKLNDVFLKLNLKERSIKINAKNAKVFVEEDFIDLSNININLDLIKFLKKENSIKKIQIFTKENSIENFTNFMNSYKFKMSRFIIYNQIKGGKFKAKTNIFFKENNKKFTYEITGKVKNTNLYLLGNNNLKNVNFNFNITDKNYNFENILFELNNVICTSEKIKVQSLKKYFLVSGKLKSKKSKIDPYSLSKFFNLKVDYFNEEKILAETDNKFSFKINSKLKIKDVDLNSYIKFDEIFINKKYQDLIYLKNGVIKSDYRNNNLSVKIQSKYSFTEDKKTNVVNEKNNLNLNIVKNNNKNIQINGDLTSNRKLIDPNVLFELANIKLDILSNEKIAIETANKFDFQIDKNQKVKHLSISSDLKFDKLLFNKKFHNLIYLKDGLVETSFKNKNLSIQIDGKYLFLNEKYKNKENQNGIKIEIIKNNGKPINVTSFFKTNKIKINSKEFIKYINLEKKIIKDQDVIFSSDNKINFLLNKKNKIENLRVKSILNFDQLKIEYKLNNLKKYIPDYKDKLYLSGDYFKLDYSKDKIQLIGNGKYSLNDKFDNFKINIVNEKKKYVFENSFDLDNILINVNEINYTKSKKIDSTVVMKGSYYKDKDLNLSEINFLEGANKIILNNLNLSNKFKVKNFDKLEFNYFNENNELNEIKILKYKNNYELTGSHFDGKSLVKNLIDGNSNNNFFKIFKNLNSNVILNLEKFYLGDQSYLEKVDGNLQFKDNKIYAGNIDAYLNNKNKFSYNLKTNSNNEKITNLFIEEPEPFIKNYKFIKGFKEGSLSYESIKINNLTKSNLKINDFKVNEVPVLAKILTLASLQGIADLLTGEGIRFNEFEMDYISKNSLTTINEMYAIGPAISILMEGFIEKDKVTSLRGTLVPATTINKTIAKIPLIGNILVGKKVGEGVFGVSFRIKGHPNNLKSTVNPIKTLTPRFVTRTLEKLKGN